jgi:hypothetical protein
MPVLLVPKLCLKMAGLRLYRKYFLHYRRQSLLNTFTPRVGTTEIELKVGKLKLESSNLQPSTF